MHAFGVVEEQFTALRGSGSLEAALTRWRLRREELRGFGDAEALIGLLRTEDPGKRPEKDAALSALCAEATSRDQCAATMLLWLLLPGLLRVRQRMDAWNALPSDDLDAELLAGVWEAAGKVSPGTRQVAARLINAARWRALAAVREAIDWEARRKPLPDQVADIPQVLDTSGETDVGDMLAAAVGEGAISETDAELLLSSRRTIAEIRQRLALSVYGAQNRRRRAKKRLRGWLDEASGEPPRSLPGPPPRKLPPRSSASPDKEPA